MEKTPLKLLMFSLLFSLSCLELSKLLKPVLLSLIWEKLKLLPLKSTRLFSSHRWSMLLQWMKIRPKSWLTKCKVLLNSKTFGLDTQPEKKISFSKVWLCKSILMRPLLLLENQDVVRVLLSIWWCDSMTLTLEKSWSMEWTLRNITFTVWELTFHWSCRSPTSWTFPF